MKTEYQQLIDSQTQGNMGECRDCRGIHSLYGKCLFCAKEGKERLYAIRFSNHSLADAEVTDEEGKIAPYYTW